MIELKFDELKEKAENIGRDLLHKINFQVLGEDAGERYLKQLIANNLIHELQSEAPKCIRCGMDLSDGKSETVICEVSMSTGGQLRYRLCRPCATDAVNEFQEMSRKSVESV